MKIYGAGLAGLLAACAFQTATLHEAGLPHQSHKALLRFRSTAVADLTGIEFTKVRVYKGIWYGGFQQPTIEIANLYSKKVLGRLQDRSIWHIEPSDRYVAPEDFITQLQSRCAGRIVYRAPLTRAGLSVPHPEPSITTVPMNLIAEMLQPTDAPLFHYAPITVRRWRLKDANVYQTIYFPDPATSLYRVSITGNLVIAEYAGANTQHQMESHFNFWKAFGIAEGTADPMETVMQRYGKIAPIDNAWRHRFMFELSMKHKLFSVGRFATWRNILLDDVVKDLQVVRKMMASTPYESLKEMGNAS